MADDSFTKLFGMLSGALRSAAGGSRGAFGPGRPNRGVPRRVPGVYRYVNKTTGKVEYHGQSNDLLRRYQEHVRGAPPRFDERKHYFEWQEQTSGGTRERQEKEQEKILRDRPRLNRNKGGGGRTPNHRDWRPH